MSAMLEFAPTGDSTQTPSKQPRMARTREFPSIYTGFFPTGTKIRQRSSMKKVTAARVARIVRSIDLSRFPAYLRVSAKHHDDGLVIRAELFTRLSEDARTMRFVESDVKVPVLVPDGMTARRVEFEICKLALQAVKNVLGHELHEAFAFKGRRIFDPHKPTRRPSPTS